MEDGRGRPALSAWSLSVAQMPECHAPAPRRTRQSCFAPCTPVTLALSRSSCPSPAHVVASESVSPALAGSVDGSLSPWRAGRLQARVSSSAARVRDRCQIRTRQIRFRLPSIPTSLQRPTLPASGSPRKTPCLPPSSSPPSHDLQIHPLHPKSATAAVHRRLATSTASRGTNHAAILHPSRSPAPSLRSFRPCLNPNRSPLPYPYCTPPTNSHQTDPATLHRRSPSMSLPISVTLTLINRTRPASTRYNSPRSPAKSPQAVAQQQMACLAGGRHCKFSRRQVPVSAQTK